MILALVSLLGLVVGSFLNVAIYRLPRGESVVYPGSHCPACGAPLGPEELIPLVSFLVQGGRCRHCGAPISRRYPVVELVSAAAFAACYLRFGLSAALPFNLVFLALLITVSATDLEHRIIPNAAVATAFVLGGALLLATRPLDPAAAGWGVLALGGFTLAVHLLRPDGLGLGDVKLAAAMGLFLGWHLGLVALFLSMFLGALVGVGLVVTRRKTFRDYLAFGPFLAAGSVLTLFFGPQLLALVAGG